MWQVIDILEAQERIIQISDAGFDGMKKQERNEKKNKLFAQAFPKNIYKRETKDASYLVSKLGGLSGR